MEQKIFLQMTPHLNLKKILCEVIQKFTCQNRAQLSSTALHQFIHFKNGLKISKIKHVLSFSKNDTLFGYKQRQNNLKIEINNF